MCVENCGVVGWFVGRGGWWAGLGWVGLGWSGYGLGDSGVSCRDSRVRCLGGEMRRSIAVGAVSRGDGIERIWRSEWD